MGHPLENLSHQLVATSTRWYRLRFAPTGLVKHGRQAPSQAAAQSPWHRRPGFRPTISHLWTGQQLDSQMLPPTRAAPQSRGLHHPPLRLEQTKGQNQQWQGQGPWTALTPSGASLLGPRRLRSHRHPPHRHRHQCYCLHLRLHQRRLHHHRLRSATATRVRHPTERSGCH